MARSFSDIWEVTMKIRNSFITLVLAIMVLCAGFSSSASSSVTMNEAKASAAARSYLPYKIYYTDATYTIECGYYSFCYDERYGCQTPYVRTVQQYCPPQ